MNTLASPDTATSQFSTSGPSLVLAAPSTQQPAPSFQYPTPSFQYPVAFRIQ
ncbi:MAG: hypothetical protein J0M15_09585 [Deltaproteobacteria bacterium]|nr:hypothetical protein [Deltaproteobacteria bacterium]